MKEIEGYEGLYKIDTFGNVYSLDRYIVDKNGKKKFYPGKKLKQETFAENYKRVTLCKNNKIKRHSVHRLVASSFIENTENKPCVNHIDNNPSNNHVDNLEWCTESENMIHAERQGRLFEAQSKGGKIAGSNLRKKAIDNHKKNYGKVFNNWKVIRLSDDKKNGQYYYLCECLLCGREYNVFHSAIKSGVSKQCRSCGLKKAFVKRKKI